MVYIIVRVLKFQNKTEKVLKEIYLKYFNQCFWSLIFGRSFTSEQQKQLQSVPTCFFALPIIYLPVSLGTLVIHIKIRHYKARAQRKRFHCLKNTTLENRITWFAISSLSLTMGLKNVILRERRKIQPCLFFERKTSNNDSTSRPDGEQFNKNNVAIIKEVRMAVFLAQGDVARMSKKRIRKRSSPEELAVRKKSIEHTLKQRRNAICSEIERSLFQQGAYLEKHRHNLQVTHELTVRGLMWWIFDSNTDQISNSRIRMRLFQFTLKYALRRVN